MLTYPWSFDGDTAKTIRAYTRGKVVDELTAALEAADLTVGEGGFEIVRSGELAKKRYQDRKPFVYLAMMPTKPVPSKVVEQSSGAAHSARTYNWRFLIQVSKGLTGSKTTSEQTAIGDDELMDIVRDYFDNAYARWRDDLHFEGLKVAMNDESREQNSVLNPILLEFSNTIRLENDEFLDT